MAIIDNRTAGRDWLLPDPANKIKDDVVRLIAALEAADGDVTAILVELGQKAALDHTHPQAEITGLVDALAAKRNTADPYALDDLSDVDASAAASGMALLRQGTVWTPVALGIGNIENLTDLLAAKAPLASPTLTGTPAAPTASPGTNTTQLATTAFVQAGLTALATAIRDGVSSTYDTLKEIADYIATIPGLITSAIAGSSINALADVDTATTPPVSGQGLVWDGTKYVPGPAGGGMFRGNAGAVGDRKGDIFRINAQTVTANVTIAADENASATGPIVVANGITLSVASGGNLTII